MRWWCRGTLALLSLSLVAASDQSKTQQMPLPAMGETIEVSIVNVDVFVTNKAGKRIQGLTRDDFEVFENGVKQPLTNFAEYMSSNAPLPLAGEGGRRPGEGTDTQKRTVVVFVERFRLPGTKAAAIVGSMKSLLRDTIRPGDAATVVTWYRGRLETLQPYTDDLAALDRALDAVKVQNTVATHDDYAEARANAQDVEDFELEAQDFAQDAGAPDVTIAVMQQSAEEMKGMAGRTDALRARADLELKVRTINALMRSMAGFDGKRVLLLATHRLSKIAGAEFYWANGVVENLDSIDRMELDTSSYIRSLHETANANGVAIYPMFPEGLGSSGAPVTTAGRFQPGGSSAFEYFIQDNEVPVLKELAARTGGRPAWGSNEVSELLASVRDDFETYYSLAYRITPRSKDKARAVEVRLKDPELRSRSRRDVIEKSDVTRMEDHVLASLVRNDVPSTLPFSVKVGTPRGKKLRIPVTIRVPISALTMLPNGPNQSGGFSVYVAWGAKLGGISEATHERQLFHIPSADVARAKKSFFTYDFELAADRRTERISVGVVDEVSREYGVRVYHLQPGAQAVLQPVRSN
jgi:VWFA-related protein